MVNPITDHLANDRINRYDPLTDKNGRKDTWAPANFASMARKTAANYDNIKGWSDDGVQFRVEDSSNADAGVHSPPLWNSTPPTSPSIHRGNNRPQSPVSRTQVIARGQRELMDMVKKLPESCYELTLKDLVEQTKMENSQEESLLRERNQDDDQEAEVEVGIGVRVGAGIGVGIPHQKMNSRKHEKKKIDGKKDVRRLSGGVENKGLFLKMGFPFGMKSRNKKSSLNSSSSAKISPKPEGSDRISKNGEKEWWRKRFSISSESDCSRSSGHSGRTGSSSSSTSTSSRRRRLRAKSGFFSSCLPAFSIQQK